MNGNDIHSVRSQYFSIGGNINSFQSGGINFVDMNAPPTTGSGTGQLRFFGNKGAISFDDNVNIQGNGSNTVVIFNTENINLTANSGFILTQTGTGGTGLLTVDAGNHLYWNGTFIA